MKHSTGKPTKREQKRIDAMLVLGCAPCAQLDIWFIAEVQHIVEGNVRMGHWYTLPYCPGHNRGAWTPEQIELIPNNLRIAITDGSKAFEGVYGTERELWMKVQQRLNLPAIWPISKIVPRRIRETRPLVSTTPGLALVEMGPTRLREGDAPGSVTVRDEEAR